MGSEGDRFNEGKAKLSMVLEAPHALEGGARVLEFGEDKYGRSNWKKGLKQTEIVDSLVRHLVAWLDGNNIDEESGLPHLDHLLCNSLFLAEMAHTHPELDDRAAAAKEARSMASKLPAGERNESSTGK